MIILFLFHQLFTLLMIINQFINFSSIILDFLQFIQVNFQKYIRNFKTLNLNHYIFANLKFLHFMSILMVLIYCYFVISFF